MDPDSPTMIDAFEPSELSSGYKLVPWSSWDQWTFVHDSIFSPNPDSIAAALRKVTAWRSRGCVPVPVDVTAAIVEIQQKDPFFRVGAVGDELNSEELLAMLYCMAVMRLVNGFVEPAHKKSGRSISELAEAVGIPRMVVDIRHESSHRNLPSLQLARQASIKALDWLKWNYWDPQKNAIPDIQKEIRSRLGELTYYLKNKHTQKIKNSQVNGKSTGSFALIKGRNRLSSQVLGKLQSRKSDGFKKQISRVSKLVARLYSAYPSEVVFGLLEFFQLHAPNASKDIGMEHKDKLKDETNEEEPASVTSSTHYFKAIVAKLSSTRPKLLLSILKTLLEMIEVRQSEIIEKSESDVLLSQNEGELFYIKDLCSLVAWLLMKLKALKDSGHLRLTEGNHVPSTDKYAAPIVSLTELLNKCLKLSVLGDKHLSYSVLLIAELIGNHRLTEKLKKLPLLHFKAHDPDNSASTVLYEDDDSIGKAEEQLGILKSRLRSRRVESLSLVDDGMWTVARSWIPCPIGMLPCTFTATAVLPVLAAGCDGFGSKEMEKDSQKDEVGLPVLAVGCDGFGSKEMEKDSEKDEVGCASEMSEAADEEPAENGSPVKKLKPTFEQEEQMLDLPEATATVGGCLFNGGICKQVGEGELVSMESKMLQFMSSTLEHLG